MPAVTIAIQWEFGVEHATQSFMIDVRVNDWDDFLFLEVGVIGSLHHVATSISYFRQQLIL
jgi:hypothetical protein